MYRRISMKKVLLFSFVCIFAACTPIPSATLTPVPTNTPMPTPTKLPKAPLESVIITNSEINEILTAEIYIRPYIVTNDDADMTIDTRVFSVVFLTTFERGTIYLTLADFPYDTPCVNLTKELALKFGASWDTELELPDNIYLPGDAWLAYYNKAAKIFGGFSVNNTCVNLEYDNLSTTTPETSATFLALIMQKQATKLKHGGY